MESELYISRATLARRFELLQRTGCNVLPLADAVRRLYAGTLPEKAVTITFDDGYCDFIGGALPLLAAYRWSATVAVTTHRCERRRVVALARILRAVEASTLDARRSRDRRTRPPLSAGFFGRSTRSSRTCGCACLATARAPMTKCCSSSSCWSAWALRARASDDTWYLRLMSAADLEDMTRRGIAIELHTHRHRLPEDGDEPLKKSVSTARRFVRRPGMRRATSAIRTGTYRVAHLPRLEREGIETAMTCDPASRRRHSPAAPAALCRQRDRIRSAGLRRGSPVWRCGCLDARARAMAFIESARQTLAGWLESREALAARHAIESIGVSPDAARSWLQSITEKPSSSACIESLVSAARHCGAIPEGDVSIERWLLVRQGLDAITSPPMAGSANTARRLTCDVIVSLAQDDPWLRASVLASNVRFRARQDRNGPAFLCGGCFTGRNAAFDAPGSSRCRRATGCDSAARY